MGMVVAVVNKVVMLMVVVGVVAVHAEAQINCVRYMTPCGHYLKRGGAVTGACCKGVLALKKLARTPADRQGICRCLKNAYAGLPGIQPRNVQGLPVSCNVHIPYKISPNIDCSRLR